MKTPHSESILLPALVGVAVLCLAMLALNAAPVYAAGSSTNHHHSSRNYCSQTTQAAFSACHSETREDYQLGWAKCLNVFNRDERDECIDELAEGRKEGADECQEARSGRNEVCELIGENRYDPAYRPEDFVDPESVGYDDGDIPPNPYFPLVPGHRWVYEAEDEIITVEVLEDTIEIDGVTCFVVRDLVVEIGGDEEGEEGTQDEHNEEAEDNLPVEDTLDWYAQDVYGNVWYFGEISLNYEEGQVVDIEGSWKTGDEGARPGILMHRHPRQGAIYRQEFLLDEAEDMAEVISKYAMPELGEDNVADCNEGCLQTLEWTPLEADSWEYKYYQAGIGMVQEADPSDPESTVELVEFSTADD